MKRSRSVVFVSSCSMTRENWVSIDSVTSGKRPTIPSVFFSVTVKAVDLLSDESRSRSIPRIEVDMFLPSPFVLFASLACKRSRRSGFVQTGFRNIRMNHLRRIDDSVELVFRHVPQLQCGLLEC